MLSERNLCSNCYMECLDRDEVELINSNEWYIETSDYEDTCERCGEWDYIAIGLARTGYNAETDEYESNDEDEWHDDEDE